jgi:hypothetical protein
MMGTIIKLIYLMLVSIIDLSFTILFIIFSLFETYFSETKMREDKNQRRIPGKTDHEIKIQKNLITELMHLPQTMRL